MYNLYRVSNLAVWLQQINKLYLLTYNTATRQPLCVATCRHYHSTNQSRSHAA